MTKKYPTVYEKGKDLYEIFSQVEDKPNKIFNFLTKKFNFKNKIILDLGCGSGKYIPFFAPLAKKYFALDAGKKLLKIAKEKAKPFNNVKIIHAFAQKIPLPKNSVDIIISTWALSAMNFIDMREKALKECLRVLKKPGHIILVENNHEGNLQKIFGYNPNPYEFNYQHWLKGKGFTLTKKIKTYFEFKNLKQAKACMTAIFRRDVAQRIKNKKVTHDVVILSKRK